MIKIIIIIIIIIINNNYNFFDNLCRIHFFLSLTLLNKKIRFFFIYLVIWIYNFHMTYILTKLETFFVLPNLIIIFSKLSMTLKYYSHN